MAQSKADQTDVPGTPMQQRAAPAASPVSTPAPPTTVYHEHGGGSGDMLTGVLVGSMLSGGHSHDTTVIHERGPAPAATPAANDSGGMGWSSDSSDSSSGSSDSGISIGC